MQITGSGRAVEVVERAKALRDGELTITIGTGCCESTAPFLYADFWPGPDQEVVGEVAGVPVYAPEYVRNLYPDDDGMVVDVVDELAESLSIETELGCRLTLRGLGVDRGADQCETPGTTTTGTPFTGRVADLPPELQGIRIR